MAAKSAVASRPSWPTTTDQRERGPPASPGLRPEGAGSHRRFRMQTDRPRSTDRREPRDRLDENPKGRGQNEGIRRDGDRADVRLQLGSAGVGGKRLENTNGCRTEQARPAEGSCSRPNRWLGPPRPGHAGCGVAQSETQHLAGTAVRLSQTQRSGFSGALRSPRRPSRRWAAMGRER